MSEKIDQIIEFLKTLTLLETLNLVHQIEKTFEIKVSANIGNEVPMTTTSNNIEPIEEKTKFNLILEEVPTGRKIPVLKVIRSLTGLGLKEAKKLVDSVPIQIKENITKTIGEEAQKQIENVGGKASLK